MLTVFPPKVAADDAPVTIVTPFNKAPAPPSPVRLILSEVDVEANYVINVSLTDRGGLGRVNYLISICAEGNRIRTSATCNHAATAPALIVSLPLPPSSVVEPDVASSSMPDASIVMPADVFNDAFTVALPAEPVPATVLTLMLSAPAS